MEKERKKISCSYAVLVIILFAALAFVTDYAIIERKMNKCNCPKCEVTTNNEEKDEPITNNENSNEHVNEDNMNGEFTKFTYTSLSGKYTSDSWDKDTYIVFNNDGTWNGNFNFCEGYADASGKYEIDGSNIIINAYESYNEVEVNGEKIKTSQFMPSKISIIDGNEVNPIILESKGGFTSGCSSSKRYVFIGE